MNVQIQSVKFDADKRLVEFVNAKMAKLDRFAERSTGAEAILLGRDCYYRVGYCVCQRITQTHHI